MSLEPTIKKPGSRIEWNKELNAWTVFQYKDVHAVLNSLDFSAAAANSHETIPTSTDPSACKEEVIAGLQERSEWAGINMEKHARKLCSKYKRRKKIDLQQEIVYPWCKEIAILFVGLYPKDPENRKLIKFAQDVFMISADNPITAQVATIELSKVFAREIHIKRRRPKEDYISELAKHYPNDMELLSPVIQLFVGILTSLPLLLGNVLHPLVLQPEQSIQYLDNPKKAAHELIRFAGPTQFVYRMTIKDITIGGHDFKRGDRLALYLAHANKDISNFKDGDFLKIERFAKAHMSLGQGVHACLGTPVIRKAVMTLPKIILETFPSMTLVTDQIKWGGSLAIRGIVNLPVANKGEK